MENSTNNTKFDEEINNNLPFPGIEKVYKAICRIISNNNHAIGFLVSLPINLGDRYLYGLLTTNQNLSENNLKIGNKLDLYLINSNQKISFIIPKSSFVFSCPFIDITFVEIPIGTFKDIEYLRVWDEPIIGQKIYALKYSNKDCLSYCEGSISGFYGSNIVYDIDEYNNNDSTIFYGTAIISQSKFCLGSLISIDIGIFLDQNKKNKLSTSINIIINSIKGLVHKNILLPLQTLPPAKNLSNEDLFILQNIGLLETENPNVFISPGTDDGITPLWFYRTQYAWFWTPKEPQNYNIEEIKKCNWSLIQSNRPITAIGGRYNNIMPALRNIKLIKTLIKYGMSYLTPDNQ